MRMCKGDGYTFQSSLILFNTLYSNITFTLDSQYFQMIVKKWISFFFQCRHPHLADHVCSCPLLADSLPPLGSDILYGWLLTGSNLAQLYSTALNRINLAVMCTFSNQLLNNLSVTNVSLNNFCKKELKKLDFKSHVKQELQKTWFLFDTSALRVCLNC